MEERKPLEEIFTDEEELEFAQKILKGVPKKAVGEMFTNAHVPFIILEAYESDAQKYNQTEKDEFLKQKEAYCKEHQIFPKLEEAGYVRHTGCVGRANLYEQPKENNKNGNNRTTSN